MAPMLGRERYFAPELRRFHAIEAGEGAFAILEMPFAMRVRTFWCTTLLLLCHSQLWPQALTKQLPPADSQGSGNVQSDGAGIPDDASVQSALPEAHVVPPPAKGVPVKIEADTQTYVKSDGTGIYTLAGHAVIHYKDYVISADHITYNQDTGDVVAEGNLHVDGGPDHAHLNATHGTVNPDAHTAHLYEVNGTLGEGRASEVKTVTNFVPGLGATQQNKMVLTSSSPFAISGKELIQTGEQKYHVVMGSMTSCMLPNPDWLLTAHNFYLENGVARGKSSLFELDGLPLIHRLPVFYLPYVTHPVNSDSRQTGFTIPIFGDDTTKGLIFGEDIYFVLSRSADLIIGSQYFSNRGFAPRAQFRYRGRGYDFATFRFNSLLDRLPGTANQGGVDFIFDGRHDFNSETRAVSDMEYLSSYTYRQEFEDNYAVAINSEVKSQAFFSRAHNSLAEGITFNRYQSFQSSAGSASGEQEITILHTPNLAFDGIDQTLAGTPLMWGISSTFAGLSRTEPGFQTSRIVPRLDVYPHLALPLHFDGWTFRPLVAVRTTFYGKSQNPGPLGIVPSERDATLNRKDFEAGMELRAPAVQRDFSAPWLERFFGGELRHTIQPSIQYRYVAGIDNFSSVLRFDTLDVASDTNELEYSIMQRLFLRHTHPHPCTGDDALGPDNVCAGKTINWLSWQIAQKYFFDDRFGGALTPNTRNVLDTTLDLTGVAFLSRARAYSPVISRLRMETTSATNIEWDVDYDSRTGRLDSSNLFAAYKRGDLAFTLGNAHLHTLAGATAEDTFTAAHQASIEIPAAPIPNITPMFAQTQALPQSVSPQLASAQFAPVQFASSQFAPRSSGVNPLPSTAAAPPEINFNQLRLSAIYGSPIKRGLSAGTSLGYDFSLTKLQYGEVQAAYNWNCCGLSFEVRRYSLGVVPEHTTYLYNFTLANVGSAGSLSWAERVF
jgi:LPS-assembly protein